MAITTDDFNKIWASTSPLTPYSFSASQYKEGWNFIGSTPPSRQMWDYLQKNNDEKMQYLLNHFDNYLPLSGGTLTGVVNGVTPPNGDNSKKLATTAFVNDTVDELTINPTVSNKVFTAIADITLDKHYNNCVRYGNLVMCNLNFTANSDIATRAKIISTPYKTINNSIGVAYGFSNTRLIPLRIDAGTNIIHLVNIGLIKNKVYDLNLCYFTKD